jgi:hypothetical protein
MLSPASGLHQMQQLLQQQILSPAQLQSLMQQHTLFLQQQQQQHHHQPVSTVPQVSCTAHCLKLILFLSEGDWVIRLTDFDCLVYFPHVGKNK